MEQMSSGGRGASGQKLQTQKSASPEPSCVSMKSDNSRDLPVNFSKESEPSCVSMKSDNSRDLPVNFSKESEPSCVSMKSDNSRDLPVNFSKESEPSCLSVKSGAVPFDSEQHSTGALPQIITLTEGIREVDDAQLRVLERHKTNSKNKYKSLFEGIKTPGSKTLLNSIYTELYIIEGESDGVNEEHEVLQMEKTPRRHQQDAPIHCSDFFKSLQGPDRVVNAEDRGLRDRKMHKGAEVQELRCVLTKGIAGIGKTVLAQKFILDWAEGAANQQVDLMFVLSFREMNLIKDDQYSLHGLLCAFHPELRDLDPEIYHQLRAVFIFDGLDERRFPLNFTECETVSDITMTSSVSVLVTNLIRGDLLPSALIWITSRPAAANQIPPQYIHRVTEIQGFTDPQKEEYFRKRIRDQDQAQKIISHIKTARSLHIMCHIPIFCWISATVLQKIITQSHTEIPKTLTEMFSHFLLTQATMKNEKYEEKHERDPKRLLESNRTKLLKLAELAFTQLLKGNVMFYEEDLRESSIDVTEAAVYSGIFTEIFKEECVIYQRKVYCFVHRSFQEFLAAVFVFHCYENNIMEPLLCFNLSYRGSSENVPLDYLLKAAVDKALKNQNGHLDLFLRFLLGISLVSNQRLLQGLLTQTQSCSEQTTGYIKRIIKGNEDSYRSINIFLTTERSINLFLCLSEMNDKSISREIEEYLKSEKHSEVKLSPAQCSALAYMLLNSNEGLDELDLRKYNTSEEGYKRLIPAITVCRKAQLIGCNLTKDSIEILCSALQSRNCPLKELDLSNNDLQDLGVKLLSAGLKSSQCKLEILRLASCNLLKDSCETLGSALLSSSLKELDLSNNDLRDPGVALLSASLKSPLCKLETLRIGICNLGDKTCENLCSALLSVNCLLKELDLSNNDLQDSGVKLLSAGLKCSHCNLEILRMSGCMITDEGYSSLASALKSKPSHLRELDLTYNNPEESGVKLLSVLKQVPHCALEKLHVEPRGEIWIKPGLNKYACDLTMDPNTAHPLLSLSEGNRKMECVREDQRPHSPERFDYYLQVLSVENLRGRCYWEVEWSGQEAAVSVSYRGIGRKGDGGECLFGRNKISWSLICSAKTYSVRHNNKDNKIAAPLSHRVAVYLDYVSGTLSFYTVSPHTHTLTHLHTFTCTFTEALYAGFRVYYDSAMTLCETE